MKTPEEINAYKRAWAKAKRAFKKKTPEEIRLARRAVFKKWREANLETNKARCKKWHIENRERARETQRKWRLANREKTREVTKIWINSNRKKILETTRAYNKAHPERSRAGSQLHRARVKRATIGNPKIIAKWVKSWRSKKFSVCYWCSCRVLTKTCHMDHIQPIGRTGAHSIENLCISCASCNRSKSVSDLQTWNSRIEQPVLF